MRTPRLIWSAFATVSLVIPWLISEIPAKHVARAAVPSEKTLLQNTNIHASVPANPAASARLTMPATKNFTFLIP